MYSHIIHKHCEVIVYVGYRGEEHCEEVDGGLCEVAAYDGHHNGGQEGQVTEREQQRRQQLATI